MIEDIIIQRVRRNLINTGGLLIKKVDKWNADCVLAYTSTLYEMCDNTPIQINQRIEKMCLTILTLIELELLNGFVNVDSSPEQQSCSFYFYQEYIYEMQRPKCLERLDGIVNSMMMHIFEDAVSYIQYYCEIDMGRVEAINILNQYLGFAIDHLESKYFVSIQSAHFHMAMDYLHSLGLDRTMKNIEENLVFKVVEVDEIKSVYYGVPKDGLVQMFPTAKSQLFEAKQIDYKIVGSKYGNRTVYYLYRVDYENNRVVPVDGPLTRKIGINL